MKKSKLFNYFLVPTCVFGTLAGASIALASCSRPIVLDKAMTINVGDEDCQMSIRITGDLYKKGVNFSWSSDDGESWQKLQFLTTDKSWYVAEQTLPANSTVRIIGNNPSGLANAYDQYCSFLFPQNVSLSGSVMSLVDNGTGKMKTIPSDYCFKDLFDVGCRITNVDKNFLPCENLTPHCYDGMFSGAFDNEDIAISVDNLPNLPATKLAKACYNNMFSNNRALEDMGSLKLPADVLAEGCYEGMFKGCKNLIKTPILKSKELAMSCYNSMFSGCEKLKELPNLPASKLQDKCYYDMFSKTGITGEADSYQNIFQYVTSTAPSCCADMFSRCSELKYVPRTLNYIANNVEDACFTRMFAHCKKLNIDTNHDLVLNARILKPHCYERMFSNCSALTNTPTMYKIIKVDEGSCSGMFQNCDNLVDASRITFDDSRGGPDDIPGFYTMVQKEGCKSMFAFCKKLTNIPILWAWNAFEGSYYTMFHGCESIKEAHLHCVNFGRGDQHDICREMFNGCTLLEDIYVHNATQFTLSTSLGGTDNWVMGVSANGRFHCKDALWENTMEAELEGKLKMFSNDTIPTEANHWEFAPLEE